MKKGARNCSKAAAPLLSAGPIRVTGMDAGGAGLVRLPDGLEVIVPGALPGDEITLAARPPQPGGRRGLAESFETLAASPDRAHDRCALAGDCGGCPMARLNYSKELELKRDLLVVEPLRAQGLLDAENAPVVEAAVGLPEEKLRGFRNKAVLYPGVLDGIPHFGYFRARSQELVPAEGCPQTPKWMEDAARTLAPFLTDPAFAPWSERTDEGILRTLILREAPETGERMAVFVVRRLATDFAALEKKLIDALAPIGLTALLLNLHEAPGSAVLSFAPGSTRVLLGKSGIEAKLLDLAFSIGAETFLQVNTPQTPVLYSLALDRLGITEDDRVLDLYCGVGTLTLLAARRARKALGIERVSHSIECARTNARANHLGNAEFLALPVEMALEREDVKAFAPTLVIADPAYQGLAGGAAEALGKLLKASGARRLAYISCNPKSFARDAAELSPSGLRLRSVTPVDMFPGAMHLEVVGIFEAEA